MQKLFEFFKTAGRLKKIKRTGWVLKGVKNAESVADHTFRVALMCLVLGKNRKLNLLKLLEMALVHDLAESVIGDIRVERGSESLKIISLKHQQERSAFRKIITK